MAGNEAAQVLWKGDTEAADIYWNWQIPRLFVSTLPFNSNGRPRPKFLPTAYNEQKAKTVYGEKKSLLD